MAKPDIWMPLYIRDYIADTLSLDAVAHGAYLLTIMAYWMNGGPIPSTDAYLEGVCRIPQAYAPEMHLHYYQIIRGFFHVDDNGMMHHGRIDHELAIARANSNKSRDAAMIRWGKSKNNAPASKSNNNAGASPKHMLGACPSPSPSPNIERENGYRLTPADAIAIYEAYPKHVGKLAAINAITKALLRLVNDPTKTPDAVSWLLERVQIFAHSPAGTAGRFTPHPATWFNAGRYEDDPEQWKNKGDANGQPTTNRGNSDPDARRAAQRAKEYGEELLL